MRAKHGAATALMVGALGAGMLLGGRPAWSAALVQHAVGDPGQTVRVSAGSFRPGSDLDYGSTGARIVAPQRAPQPASVISANSG